MLVLPLVIVFIIFLFLFMAYVAMNKHPKLTYLFSGIALVITIIGGVNYPEYLANYERKQALLEVELSKLEALKISNIKREFKSEKSYIDYINQKK